VLTSTNLPFLAKADGRVTPDYKLKADPIIITLNPILLIRVNVEIPSLLNLMKVVYWVLPELIVIFSTCKITSVDDGSGIGLSRLVRPKLNDNYQWHS
jgi:hypothetical protein